MISSADREAKPVYPLPNYASPTDSLATSQGAKSAYGKLGLEVSDQPPAPINATQGVTSTNPYCDLLADTMAASQGGPSASQKQEYNTFCATTMEAGFTALRLMNEMPLKPQDAEKYILEHQGEVQVPTIPHSLDPSLEQMPISTPNLWNLITSWAKDFIANPVNSVKSWLGIATYASNELLETLPEKPSMPVTTITTTLPISTLPATAPSTLASAVPEGPYCVLPQPLMTQEGKQLLTIKIMGASSDKALRLSDNQCYVCDGTDKTHGGTGLRQVNCSKFTGPIEP